MVQRVLHRNGCLQRFLFPEPRPETSPRTNYYGFAHKIYPLNAGKWNSSKTTNLNALVPAQMSRVRRKVAHDSRREDQHFSQPSQRRARTHRSFPVGFNRRIESVGAAHDLPRYKSVGQPDFPEEKSEESSAGALFLIPFSLFSQSFTTFCRKNIPANRLKQYGWSRCRDANHCPQGQRNGTVTGSAGLRENPSHLARTR